MEKGGARGCVLARHVPTRGRWVLTKPRYTDRHQPANGHHQPLNGHQQALGGVQSPRELQSDLLPWWGGWGEHAELISAVSLSRCFPAPCEARRQPSRSAPAKQPLCLERGSWPGSQRGPWPTPFPPQASNTGGHSGWLLGGPPSHGCPEPRWACKAPRAVPGEEASPCLIVVFAIKVGHKGPASWVTLLPAICSGLGLATGPAPARD